MKKSMIVSIVLVLFLLLPVAVSAQGKEDAGPVTIEWWGEFTGFEAEGTMAAVARYNEIQSDVIVNYVLGKFTPQEEEVGASGEKEFQF